MQIVSVLQFLKRKQFVKILIPLCCVNVNLYRMYFPFETTNSYCVVQSRAEQSRAEQSRAEQSSAMQCNAVLYCITFDCTALHCTALHSTALHCTALHCTALHCTALHCTALGYTAHHIALRCVALRCVALRCVALRCVALTLSVVSKWRLPIRPTYRPSAGGSSRGNASRARRHPAFSAFHTRLPS